MPQGRFLVPTLSALERSRSSAVLTPVLLVEVPELLQLLRQYSHTLV